MSQKLGGHSQRPVERFHVNANRIRPHHTDAERAGVGNTVMKLVITNLRLAIDRAADVIQGDDMTGISEQPASERVAQGPLLNTRRGIGVPSHQDTALAVGNGPPGPSGFQNSIRHDREGRRRERWKIRWQRRPLQEIRGHCIRRLRQENLCGIGRWLIKDDWRWQIGR